MKKKEIEALRQLSLEELRLKVTGLRRDYFSAHLHSTSKPLKDVMFFNKTRKDIARILTILKEKQALS